MVGVRPQPRVRLELAEAPEPLAAAQEWLEAVVGAEEVRPRPRVRPELAEEPEPLAEAVAAVAAGVVARRLLGAVERPEQAEARLLLGSAAAAPRGLELALPQPAAQWGQEAAPSA